MTHFLTLLQENTLLSTVVRLLLAAVLAVILNLVLPKESQGEKPVTATTAAEGAGKVQVYDELGEP